MRVKMRAKIRAKRYFPKSFRKSAKVLNFVTVIKIMKVIKTGKPKTSALILVPIAKPKTIPKKMKYFNFRASKILKERNKIRRKKKESKDSVVPK